MVHATYQLTFRNKKYSKIDGPVSSTLTSRSQKCKEICVSNEKNYKIIIYPWFNSKVPIRGRIFFDLFPFYIIFNRNLEILSLWESLQQAIKSVIGESIKDIFKLVRPTIPFTWDEVSY